MNPATAMPQLGAPSHTFTQLLSATRRGARLARLLAVTELRSWGIPPELTERAELVVAELANNAVLHGRTPDRFFRLSLAYDPSTGELHIEATDTHGYLPPNPPAPIPDPEELPTHGRGLTLITALTNHWHHIPHPDGTKTVRAHLAPQAPA